MIFSIPNKHACFIILGLLVAMPLIASGASFVFASTTQTTASRTNLANNGQSPGPGKPAFPHQENNQTLQGVNNGGGNATIVGADQGNSGNQGVNNGFNQANNANGGNQISSQRKNIGFQVNNQALQATNNGGGNTTLIGNNQGNSGNQGINRGNNQDNSGNSGNQVNNQGDIIGTQVNAPGTEVNNQGSTIEHQIDYIDLLPRLAVGLRLYPRPQLALNAGG